MKEIANHALKEDRGLNWPWEQVKSDARRYHDHRNDEVGCEWEADDGRGIRGPGTNPQEDEESEDSDSGGVPI